VFVCLAFLDIEFAKSQSIFQKNFIAEKWMKLPTNAGVYYFLDVVAMLLLYLGKSVLHVIADQQTVISSNASIANSLTYAQFVDLVNLLSHAIVSVSSSSFHSDCGKFLPMFECVFIARSIIVICYCCNMLLL